MPRVLLVVLALLCAGLASALPLPATSPGPAPKSMQADCGTGADLADGPEGARLLADGERCSGRLGPDDPADWFRVGMRAGHVLRFSTSGQTTADAYTICAQDPGDDERCFARSAAAVPVRIRVHEAGDWAVGVTAANVATGPYTVLFTQEGPFTWDDCATGDDAPDTGSGVAIALPAVCSGAITRDGLDAVDRYAFDVPAGERVRVRATQATPSYPMSVCLRGPTAEECQSSFSGVFLFGEPTVAGTWTLQVSGPRGSYALDVLAEPVPAPNDCMTGLDAGSGPESALALDLPVSCRASFEPGSGDAMDWYAFDVGAGELLTIDPRAGANARACLLAPTGEAFGCSDGQYPYALPLRVQAPFAGRYFLSVESLRPWLYYDLDASITSTGGASQDDCGSGQDAGEHAAAALPLALGVACEARIESTHADMSDWYALPLAAGDDVTLELTESGEYALGRLCVFAPGEALPRDCHETGTPGMKRFETHAEREGLWLVRVTREGGADYSLRATAGAMQDDCGAGRDAGATRQGAVGLGAGGACAGAFPPLVGDVVDWYVVSATGGALVAAQWQTQPLFVFEGCIHAPDGATRACSRDGRVSVAADEPGGWFVSLRRLTGTGAYELTAAAV